MTWVVAYFLAAVGGTILAYVVDRGIAQERLRRESTEIITDSATRLLGAYQRELEDPQPEPDFQIQPWTPDEREALGHNDLMRWIEETDRELARAEWAEVTKDSRLVRFDGLSPERAAELLRHPRTRVFYDPARMCDMAWVPTELFHDG